MQTRLASILSLQAFSSAVLPDGSHIDSHTGTYSMDTLLKTSLSEKHRVWSTIENIVGHAEAEVVVHAVPALVLSPMHERRTR